MTGSPIKTLFGYPVCKYKIEPSSYNKNGITDVINNNYRKQPYRDKWNRGDTETGYSIHHSYDDHENDNQSIPDFSSLIDVYREKIDQFMCDTDLRGHYTFEIANYTVINQGQSMPKHNHLNLREDNAFAATHYLSFHKNEHASLVFHNDTLLNKIHSFSEISKMVDHKNTVFGYLNHTYTIDIDEDDFVIFPSCLDHSVPVISETTSKKNRICVALNIVMSRHQK